MSPVAEIAKDLGDSDSSVLDRTRFQRVGRTAAPAAGCCSCFMNMVFPFGSPGRSPLLRNETAERSRRRHLYQRSNLTSKTWVVAAELGSRTV
jgi:hypothetical protein